jgi:hypothetical protein
MSWLPLPTDVSVGIIREITIPRMAWWETKFDSPFDQFLGDHAHWTFRCSGAENFDTVHPRF